MSAEIHHLNVATTVPHDPDHILEKAKGQGFDAVLVVGYNTDKPLDIRASTSDVERVIFMLEWAKQEMVNCARKQSSEAAE